MLENIHHGASSQIAECPVQMVNLSSEVLPLDKYAVK